ncbi:MAG: T9SS type A sorting domain-containing protein [Chitinophagales bacterium]|nr:T9SS type A sorting domain-containing protein [Chitinophagales bacterium]
MKIAAVITLILFSLSGFTQTTPFDIHLKQVNISGLGGLQSYAFGQHNGKWLIVGGRLDGLHRRQPFASFDIAGHNNQIIVIDPTNEQVWTAPLTNLPDSIEEQLSSTNMQFFQEGDYLYCVGGYGYSSIAGDHTTYDKLTAIKVDDVIDAVINNTNFISFFRQISDANFQVTGGKLLKINNTFYLVGGQKFLGRYNPMGPNHGPGFFQEYTDAIRRFDLSDDGTNITITHLSPVIDSVNLHRRDYNLVQQILPDGSEGLTVFSGVFQQTVDLPFLNSVTIDSTSYSVNNTFQQYYNHYHCAVLPLYSASNNQMHTVFFGGIAQYYDSSGILVQDNNVPFTRTIARVTRDPDGSMAEYKLPIEMPALLGSGSEFIPVESVPQFSNQVFRLDDLNEDSTMVGYIYGGINSTAKNIFWINTGTESTASSQIFEVYVLKGDPLGDHELNHQSSGTLNMRAYPNPNNGDFIVQFNLRKITETRLSLYNIKGKKLEEDILDNLKVGENTYQRKIKSIRKGGVFILTIETPYEQATQKIIVE